MMPGFERYSQKTRRAELVEEMPWGEMCALIESHDPQAGKGTAAPLGLERILRIYFLQQWFNLSDPEVEEGLYDSAALRQFTESRPYSEVP